MKPNLSSFLQSRTNVYLYRTLGWKATFAYIMFLGRLYYILRPMEKQKIIQAIESVFVESASLHAISTLRRMVFKGIIFHYYEKLFNAYSEIDTLKAFFRSHIRTQSFEAIDEGLSKGKGVLLITGHFGGVEFLPAFLGTCQYPVTIVARFKSAYLRQISIQKAGQFNTKIIDADHTANAMKEITRSFKENRIVITMCDEIDEWRPSPRERISFLGKVTRLDRTLNILCRRGRADIAFGVMRRNGSYGYTFIGSTQKQMKDAVPGSAKLSPGALALKFLEQYIYVHPEEWYQWKKYFQIEPLPPSDITIERLITVPVLNPSLGKVS